MMWWGIGLGVAMEMALEVEVNGGSGIEVRVTGPQLGKALAHHMECILHCARLNWLVAGGKAAIMVELGKELEDKNRVRDVGEGLLISAKGLLAKGMPMEPCLLWAWVHEGMTLASIACHSKLRSAWPLSWAEGSTNAKAGGCGYTRSKYASNCESVRYQR